MSTSAQRSLLPAPKFDLLAMPAACFQGRVSLGRRAPTFIAYEPKATLQRQPQPQPSTTQPKAQSGSQSAPEVELSLEWLQQSERSRAATPSATMLGGLGHGFATTLPPECGPGTTPCLLSSWSARTDHHGAGTLDQRDVSIHLQPSSPRPSDDLLVPPASLDLSAWECFGDAVTPEAARSLDDPPDNSPTRRSPSCHREVSDSASSFSPKDGQCDLRAYPHMVSSPDRAATSTNLGVFSGDSGCLTGANDLAVGRADSDELPWIHPSTSSPAGCVASSLSTPFSSRPTTPVNKVGQQALEGPTTRAPSFQEDGADRGKTGRLLRANLRTVAPGSAFVALVITSPDSGSIQPLEHLQNVTPHQQLGGASVQDWAVEMLAAGTWLLTGFLLDVPPSTLQDHVPTCTPQLEGSARSQGTASTPPRKRPRRTVDGHSSPERTGESCSDSDYDDASDIPAYTIYAKSRKHEKWRPLEDARLLAYRAEGMSWPRIHRCFPNRSPGSVTTHWYNLQDRKRRSQRITEGIVG